MKRFVRYSTVIAVALACASGTARAQTSGAASTDDRGYVEIAAAATLGHKSDSSVGGEAGYRLTKINSPVVDELYVFFEGGHMGNVATSTMDAHASLIGNAIGATVNTKQEADYYDAGLKFRVMPLSHGAWHPYVLLGFGAASVKSSTNFFIAGNDVTSKLDTLGVLLGEDLSSTITKPFFTVGVGANAKFGKRLFVDATYRYGRISAKTATIENDVPITTQRVQAGVGIRF